MPYLFYLSFRTMTTFFSFLLTSTLFETLSNAIFMLCIDFCRRKFHIFIRLLKVEFNFSLQLVYPNIKRKVFMEKRGWKLVILNIIMLIGRGEKIITAEVCPDHVHMLVEIPPKMTVSGFMGFLKEKQYYDISEMEA